MHPRGRDLGHRAERSLEHRQATRQSPHTEVTQWDGAPGWG
jgi:hypothetical protein